MKSSDPAENCRTTNATKRSIHRGPRSENARIFSQSERAISEISEICMIPDILQISTISGTAEATTVPQTPQISEMSRIPEISGIL